MTVLINVGWLVDATGAPPRRNASVLLDDDRIVQIDDLGSLEAPDARVIDAPNSTLLPGFFDLHAHPCGARVDPPSEPVDPSFRKDDLIAAKVFKAARALQILLQTGVTTIRDAGAARNLAVAMKEAVAEGLTPGPRVFASGSLIAQTGGLRLGNEDIAEEITGADEARRVARQQLKAGVDVLKIYGSASIAGGGGRLIGPPGWPHLTVDEMRAVVEEAHKAGRLASAHAISTEAIKNAISAGVDWVDHATMLDDEAIEMLLKTNTPIVPTIGAPWAGEQFGAFGEFIAKKCREIGAIGRVALRKAHEAGVRVATGTDWCLPPGGVAKECEIMTEAGLTPMEAIIAATRTPADILRVGDRLGTVEIGKIADLLIVPGNPVEDIRCLSYDRVEQVIQAGQPLEAPRIDISRLMGMPGT